MKHRTKWLLLFLALIGVVWAFPTVLFYSPLGPAAFERKINAKIPGHLTIGKTTVRILPRLGLLLHAVKWQGPSSSQTYSMDLDIQTIDLGLRFPALLRGFFETDVGMIQSLKITEGNFVSKRHLKEGEIRKISVKHTHILITHLNRDGSLNLKGSTTIFAGPPTLVDLNLEIGSLLNPAATKHRIEIRSGTADISGMIMLVQGEILHQSPFSQVDMTLTTKAFSFQSFFKSFPATAASLPKETADGTTLSVWIRGPFFSEKTIPVGFLLESPELIYAKPVPTHIAQALIEGVYDNGILRFSKLHGKVCKGTLAGSGHVDLPKAAKPIIYFDLHGKDLALKTCNTIPLTPHLTGNLDGHLRLYGTFHKQDDKQFRSRIPRWISGNGEINLRQGRIQNLKLLHTIGTTLQQFVDIPTMANHHFRDESWHNVQASFSFQQGIVNISALTMDSDAMQFKARGDIGARDQLDMSGNVILGADLMQNFGSKIFYFLTPEGLLVVPLAITGTIDQPHVVLDLVGLLHQTTLGQAKKFIPPPIQKEFRDLFLTQTP